jgi:hypothetical protein
VNTTDQQVLLEDLIRGTKKVMRERGSIDCLECGDTGAEDVLAFLIEEWRALTGEEPQDAYYEQNSPWPCSQETLDEWCKDRDLKTAARIRNLLAVLPVIAENEPKPR